MTVGLSTKSRSSLWDWPIWKSGKSLDHSPSSSGKCFTSPLRLVFMYSDQRCSVLNVFGRDGNRPVIKNHSMWKLDKSKFQNTCLPCRRPWLGFFLQHSKGKTWERKIGRVRLSIVQIVVCSMANTLPSGKCLGHTESHVDWVWCIAWKYFSWERKNFTCNTAFSKENSRMQHCHGNLV